MPNAIMNTTTNTLTDHEKPLINLTSLVSFLCITFGLTWGILALFIFLPAQATALFGPLTGKHPLFFLAVYAPALAAFSIVAHKGGARGLRQFLGRFLLWRCSWPWYAFLILAIPLLFFLGAAVQGKPIFDAAPFSSVRGLALGVFLMAIKGPVEEFGWRGLALPLLQRKLAPIWAGLILGIIWALWHFPAFLLSDTPQGAWSFTPFFAGSVAVSVIMTQLFNASRGSILLPALFHFQLINPIWPDAQPYDMLWFILAAVVVVCLNRKSLFTRAGAVTEVVPK